MSAVTSIPPSFSHPLTSDDSPLGEFPEDFIEPLPNFSLSSSESIIPVGKSGLPIDKIITLEELKFPSFFPLSQRKWFVITTFRGIAED